jgi:hypothetical protein
MKKYQVPKTRRKAAMIQPIHTMVWTARSLLRSEGMRIPDCLPRQEGRLSTGKRGDAPTTQAPPPFGQAQQDQHPRIHRRHQKDCGAAPRVYAVGGSTSTGPEAHRASPGGLWAPADEKMTDRGAMASAMAPAIIG